MQKPLWMYLGDIQLRVVMHWKVFVSPRFPGAVHEFLHKNDSSYFPAGQDARHCCVSMFPTLPGGQVVIQYPASSYSLDGQLVTQS